MSVSILILTLNEEVNLPGCLQSVKWADEVVVFDSYSTDSTVEIAQNFGAKVVQREFDNYSAHRNYAIKNIPFKNKWIFSLDADERITTELKDEIITISQSKSEYSAFRLRYKNMFLGKWIKRSSFYPTWLIRFFQPEKTQYEDRVVNAHPIVDGRVGELQHHFEHYSFNKGFKSWFKKHNRYSTMEAHEYIKQLNNGEFKFSEIFSSDPIIKRRAQKNLLIRMPFRPLIKFSYMYFIRLGILDGKPGFFYCVLQSFYEFMISMKTKEIRRREKGLSV